MPILFASGADEAIPIVAIIGGCIVGMVSIIGGLMYRWRAKTLEADLKYEMIQRGMSADDIERVLAARMSGKD